MFELISMMILRTVRVCSTVVDSGFPGGVMRQAAEEGSSKRHFVVSHGVGSGGGDDLVRGSVKIWFEGWERRVFWSS